MAKRQGSRLIPLIAILLPGLASAQEATKARVVFACSFGAKQVEVIGSGTSIAYRFGPPGKPEIVLAAATRSDAVGHHYQLFPHAAHRHIRFTNGEYRYVLFSRFRTPDYRGRGAEDVQGLLVLRGGEIILRRNCRSGPGFSAVYDYEWLSPDPDDLSELAERDGS